MKRIPAMLLRLPLLIAVLGAAAGCQPAAPLEVTPAPVSAGTAAPTPLDPGSYSYADVYAMVSSDSLLGYLQDLVAIEPYSGWRNSASSGEAQALDHVAATLQGFSRLQAAGMTIERQSFDVYLATEIREAGLSLTVDGQETAVITEGLRGARYSLRPATYFDTDGGFNDLAPDPVSASGTPLVVREEDLLYSLQAQEVAGRILFLDYALIDTYTSRMSGDGSTMGAAENASRLFAWIDQGLAGVVLVTSFSNVSGESQGTIISEGGTFAWNIPARRVPLLYVRLEDLSAAGIHDWEGLEAISAARMTLDADVLSPGSSGNLVARIPGADPSRAVILGAHIDSPNTPGALDDGSGSAALLEVGRVLDASAVQPGVDVYLVWFGSEEIGLYGSTHFVATHQELLDRTLAMVQMDGMAIPLEGKQARITMLAPSYEQYGDAGTPLPAFLGAAMAEQGIAMETFVDHGLSSDNNSFDAFNVPALDLAYVDASLLNRGDRSIHYYANWHSPYETVERVEAYADVLADMTRVMLGAALEIGAARPDLRVTPAPDGHALVVGTHSAAFGLIALRDLGMALAWEGFDVDLIPYGQALMPADLVEAGVVILPPALNAPGAPPEVWSEAEIALLQGYVEGGGLLVVVNSAREYCSLIDLQSPNLEVRAFNDLLEPMGVRFLLGGTGSDDTALAGEAHALSAGAGYLALNGENSVAFRMTDGLVLYRGSSTAPLVGLVGYGEQGGEVLVVSERGLLKDSSARNLVFLQNLARYVRAR